MKIRVTTSVKEELENQPLFFLKYFPNVTYDRDGNRSEYPEWKSVDTNLNISFPANDFGSPKLGYCLCIVDDFENVLDERKNIKENVAYMNFHAATGNSQQDFKVILDNYIKRNEKEYDKYSIVPILWLLDKKGVYPQPLQSALDEYDDSFIHYLLNMLGNICRCLSYNRQTWVKQVFDTYARPYEIFQPASLIEAIKLYEPSYDYRNDNLFQLVDRIISYEKQTENEQTSENMFIQLRKWMSNDEAFYNYNVLPALSSLVDEPFRLSIVKRYFHDIRLQHTTLNPELLKQLKDNPYEDFILFRYAIRTPTDQIVLTVPFLCDSILTLHQSHGAAFQTFDGILDFAMTHCDTSHPAIDFRLNRIIPVCKCAAVYNDRFKGFIDYQTIIRIDEGKFTQENLLRQIREILDNIGRRKTYPVCRHDNGAKIDEEQFKKCSQKFTLIVHSGSDANQGANQITSKANELDCYFYKPYDDKWLIYPTRQNLDTLATLLAEPISHYEENTAIEIDIEMVSAEVFRKYLLSLLHKCQQVDADQYIISSDFEKTDAFKLFQRYIEPLCLRVFPQKGALVGSQFDIFGYRAGNNAPSMSSQYYDEKESEEVNRRTVESLKKELKISDYNGSYFEIPYDWAKLHRLLKKYYFRETLNPDDEKEEKEFLKTVTANGHFRYYCAPELSKSNNPAIDIPFFWCQGRECFHNNLANQTLAETDDWQEYTLYHLIEIINYPKIHKTPAGYEPDIEVRNFIAITNKAMQKFKRLKCRACGHLMFTHQNGNFNSVYYYSCLNPDCTECRQPVYLNYCYSCKKGLIDSRDSKSCPNGWFVCPRCLACCDDSVYERQAQRYLVSNQPVPERIQKMLGHGHNDKGQYFCPDCGGPITIEHDSHGIPFRGCKNCHKNFDTQEEGFY